MQNQRKEKNAFACCCQCPAHKYKRDCMQETPQDVRRLLSCANKCLRRGAAPAKACVQAQKQTTVHQRATTRRTRICLLLQAPCAQVSTSKRVRRSTRHAPRPSRPGSGQVHVQIILEPAPRDILSYSTKIQTRPRTKTTTRHARVCLLPVWRGQVSANEGCHSWLS